MYNIYIVILTMYVVPSTIMHIHTSLSIFAESYDIYYLAVYEIMNNIYHKYILV